MLESRPANDDANRLYPKVSQEQLKAWVGELRRGEQVDREHVEKLKDNEHTQVSS